jgi:GTP-binding protein
VHAFFSRCQFLLGAHTLSQAPADSGAEVAFAGRSNAGKSSAINAITGINSLARVSKTPGRTQQINFFDLGEQRRLVDLPGYGYAKVPDRIKRHWQETLGKYLQTRTSLEGLIVVMDIRHPLMPGDMQLLEGCEAVQLPVHILLSKADKLSHGRAANVHAAVQHSLHKRYGTASDAGSLSVQIFSALRRTSIAEAQQRIVAWLPVVLPHKEAKKSPDPKGGRKGAEK